MHFKHFSASCGEKEKGDTSKRGQYVGEPFLIFNLSKTAAQNGARLQAFNTKICLSLFGKFTFRQVPVHSNKVGKVGFVVINGLHNQTTSKISKTFQNNKQATHISLRHLSTYTHNKATSTASSAPRKDLPQTFW